MVLEHWRSRPRTLARSVSMPRNQPHTTVSCGPSCLRAGTSGARPRRYGRHRNTGVLHAEPHGFDLYVRPSCRALYNGMPHRRFDTIFDRHRCGSWRVVFEEPFSFFLHFPPICWLCKRLTWHPVWRSSVRKNRDFSRFIFISLF